MKLQVTSDLVSVADVCSGVADCFQCSDNRSFRTSHYNGPTNNYETIGLVSWDQSAFVFLGCAGIATLAFLNIRNRSFGKCLTTVSQAWFSLSMLFALVVTWVITTASLARFSVWPSSYKHKFCILVYSLSVRFAIWLNPQINIALENGDLISSIIADAAAGNPVGLLMNHQSNMDVIALVGKLPLPLLMLSNMLSSGIKFVCHK